MAELRNPADGLHHGQPILTAGEPLDRAQAAMILLHRRGSTATEILKLATEFRHPGFAFLAPQAAENTWYPNRFLAPIESNEPWLTSALGTVAALLERIHEAGISPERTVLLGFSQGACLALEYTARNPRRYGSVVGLSGALIGHEMTSRETRGNPLAGTPVFVGCSDIDFHIPKDRVIHAAEVLKAMGGNVTLRLYMNMDHSVNSDEIETVRDMMAALTREMR